MTRGEFSVRLAGAARALNASGLPWETAANTAPRRRGNL